MPQFSVHKNKNAKSKSAYPYLVEIQSDLLRDLNTRVVVPLVKLSDIDRKPIHTLTPVVDIDGQKYAMLIPQLAGIPARDLGASIGSVATRRADIVAAMDFLVTGI